MVLTRLPAQRESIHNHSALQWSKLHPPKMGLCRSHSRDCPRWVLLWLLSHSKPGIRCKLFQTLFFIRMCKSQTEPQYFASAAWFHAPSVPRVMQLSPAAAALPPALSSMQPVWEAKQPSEPLGTYSPSEINWKKKYFFLSAFVWPSFQKAPLPLARSLVPRPCLLLASLDISKFTLCRA